MATRAQEIRERYQLAIEKIDVPGMGELWVKKLSAGAVGKLEKKGAPDAPRDDAETWSTLVDIVIAGTCDEHRAPIFGNGDRQWLRDEVDLETLQVITDAIQKLNPTIWKSAEDVEKNSVTTPSSDSSSDSPVT